MSTAEYDTDVIVVGTGPMGATATLALATYGARVQAVTRWNWLAHTPRAHITNQRAVEVLRDLGVEEEAVRCGTPWDLMGDMTIATSYTGPEIARLRIWGSGDDRNGDYVQGSPCSMLDVIQPLMEQLLVTAAARRGAQISLNTEYLGHEQDDDGVTVTLKDLITGSVYTRRAQFLVGADGARSQIADEIGLEIVGHHARGGHVYAGFTADLSQYAAHRPSTLNYIMNPATGYGEIGMGLLRATRPWDQWIAGWGVDLNEGEPNLDHGHASEQIRTLVGDPELQPEIEWVAPWYVNQAFAVSDRKSTRLNSSHK
jgi:2,4-dichlorophenol 6-monooxygenase